MTTPTPTPSGEMIGTQDGLPIIVEQGPRWLAGLLYNPPGWVPAVLGLTILLGSVWVAYQLAERGLEREEGLAMLQNVLTVAACGAVTVLLVRHARFSYLVDVGVGSSVGIVLALCGRVLVDRALDRAGVL
jgi:hypothetical protein